MEDKQHTTALAVIVERPEIEFDRLLKMAGSLVKTHFLPNAISTPDQAAMIILTGRELGIPAMQALRTVNVIQGKPALSAELMAALVLRAGNRIDWVNSTEQSATCKITRKDGSSFAGSFTIAEAKRAGLVKDGGGWTKYPAALLRARALSLTARAICPDAIAGFYIPEELGADVDESGQQMDVADTPPVSVPKRLAPKPPTPVNAAAAAFVDAVVGSTLSAPPAAEPAPADPTPIDGYEHGIYVGPVVQVTGHKKAKDFWIIEGRDNWKARTFDTKVMDFAIQALELKGEVKIEWVATKFGNKAITITATGDGTTAGDDDSVPF